MITTIYNPNNDKIDIEITNYDGEFEIISCQIQSNDIANEIFTGILGTELTLNILSKDDTIYNGSLIGKEINLTINNSDHRHYTIITNVASMPANFIQEEIEISAVDDITMLKNKRYNLKSFNNLQTILSNILGDFIILDGWGGTDQLLKLTFNTSTLWQDEGNTPPTQYEVIEAITKYINRSLFFDYSQGMYVFFNANKLNAKQNAVKVLDGVQISTTYSVPAINIHASSIAQADRNVTLSDPWQSAQVTAKFDDLISNDVKPTYKETEDVGTKTIGKKKIKYSAYFGDNGGTTKYAPSIGSLANLTIANIEQAVANGEYGACVVQLATAELSGENDAEGNRSGDEYIMFYGCLNTPSNERTPLYEYIVNTDTITTNDTVAVVQDTVIYSDYPFPYESGKFTCYYPNLVMQFAMNDDSFNALNGFDLHLDFPNNNAVQPKGQPLTNVNEVTWNWHLKNKGKIVSLNQGFTKPLNKLRLRMFPNLWYTYYTLGIQDNPSARPSQYEFHKIRVNIERRAKVEEELFDTDTIIKAINDGANGITINGYELDEKPKFVTYDGKKAGGNCVYLDKSLSLPNSENVWPDYILAEGMTDDARYYGRTNCTSEERFVADINNHYFRNLFGESITIKGIRPLFGLYKDVYFNKKMVLTNATINITEGTTKITCQEM